MIIYCISNLKYEGGGIREIKFDGRKKFGQNLDDKQMELLYKKKAATYE